MIGKTVYNLGICDDSREICDQLMAMLTEIEEKERLQFDIQCWDNGKTLCDRFENGYRPDLLFLDIEMGQKSGIEVSEFIREWNEDYHTAIVFISGKAGYAVDVCRFEPFDYLVKPIEKERLAKVIRAFLKKYDRENMFFEYTCSWELVRILYKDISSFSSRNRKIHITTQSGENYECSGKLSDIAKVAPHNFIFIGHSFLINMDHIKSCRYENVMMRSGEILPISRNYRKRVRDILMEQRWDS